MSAWHEDGGACFAVWAPDHERVEVVLCDEEGRDRVALSMDKEGGWFRRRIERVPATEALRYRFRIDGPGGSGSFPDPASRSQPLGVHGPSELPAASTHVWSDAAFPGLGLRELVIYELHVGTATPTGTFDALVTRLPAIADLGVTAIELMPVASFPGRRNWGYDGVSLYAPQAGYGGPDDLRRLVDAAHALGLGVLLDVVYNHLGPDGNYLGAYSRRYFTARHHTPWGDAIDYTLPEVRAFAVENAAMWIADYHLDGLRLDATHALYDGADGLSLLAEIAHRARAAAPHKRVLVIAEDERNERRLVLPESDGGCGLDAVWADDFHHQLRRALAGDHESYFRDYSGGAADLALTLQKGWFYEGQVSAHRERPRGTPATGIAPEHFVHCIQNHDQIGNRAFGDRLGASISPAAYRVASALLLLSPYTPLLFMGQEWNATTPFLYFTDHGEPLGSQVREGRRAEFRHFTHFSGAEVPDPQADDTFLRSKLDWDEADEPAHRAIRELYRELLRLRKTHPALQERSRESFAASAIGQAALVLQRCAVEVELLLVCNLRGELFHSVDVGYRVLLSTEDARFGGTGTVTLAGGVVRIAGPGALLLEKKR